MLRIARFFPRMAHQPFTRSISYPAGPCFKRLFSGEGHTFPVGSLTDRVGWLYHQFETLKKQKVDIRIGPINREFRPLLFNPSLQDILLLDRKYRTTLESEGGLLKAVAVNPWNSQIALILAGLSHHQPITFKLVE